MIPKEKAKDLLNKLGVYFSENAQAKQCALIAVDEILKINKLQDIESQNYWLEVKQEIDKLC